MNFIERYVGNGNVVLIAGGGKVYADVAARFVRSERNLESIAASPHDGAIIRNLLSSGHLSALEFDWFLFGVEGYSRVCEAQLVRKRHASYMVKSGRVDMGGQREFSVVWPDEVADFRVQVFVPGDVFRPVALSGRDLAGMLSQWYDAGVSAGIPEQDLRYLKPQATEFKAIIGMNAHALRDFFRVRCCRNAQFEIRDMANKMLNLCMDAAPELFEGAGPNCVELGYCPENGRQNEACRGRVPTKDEALRLLEDVKVRERKDGKP